MKNNLLILIAFKIYFLNILNAQYRHNNFSFFEDQIGTNGFVYSLQSNSFLNKSSNFKISYNLSSLFNSGHSNIDNNAEIYSPGKFSTFTSAKVQVVLPMLYLEIEPYRAMHYDLFNRSDVKKPYNFTNNHLNDQEQSNIGFKNSRLIIHYKGIGMSYGNVNHWWGPGFHSAISLSSNAFSQKTFSFGTFEELNYKNFYLHSRIIVIPYRSLNNEKLFFSGFKGHISYLSSKTLITLGIHRSFSSGNFKNQPTTNSQLNWSFDDAAKLVLSPLFTKDKKDLDYTIIGTPGFDLWDEMLSAFFSINFLDLDLEIYTDVASDDSRSNFIDLRAHWDHALAYQLGFKKTEKLKNIQIFYGIEYTTTRISNTFNSEFYRGSPYQNNFYSKSTFDYFTYRNRLMGAHSGSNSDDLIYLISAKDNKNMISFSFNRERHGIKSMDYPELKSEILLSYQRNINNNHFLFFAYEHEKIYNFSFRNEMLSIGNLFWFGYSFIFKK